MDFYFVRKEKFAITDMFRADGVYGRWGKNGLLVYFIGIAVEVPFMYLPNLYTSWGATQLQLVDISWVIGLIVSGVLYLALSRNIDRGAELKAIAESEATLAKNEEVR